MIIPFKRLDESALSPKYHSKGSSGFDLHALSDYLIDRGQTKLVRTGLSFAIPEGYEIQIRPRSGLSLKTDLRIPNSPGTIDSDFRGEVQIITQNTGNRAYKINKGDRIAQGVVVPVIKARLEEVHELEETVRAKGGFGSTGI